MPLPDMTLQVDPPIITSEGEVIPARADPEPFGNPPDLPPMTTQEPRMQTREPRRRPVSRVSVEADPDHEEKRRIRRGKGQPSEEEWAEFFAKYALDWLMSGYIWLCFRGVDDTYLDEEFWESLEADEEDIASIADALSSFAHGTTISKRYGRKIVSSAALLDATHALGMWAISVNKAAARIRREQRQQGLIPERKRKEQPDVHPSAETTTPDGQYVRQAVRQYPDGIRIINPGGA